MIQIVATLSLLVVGLGIVLCLHRAVLGPTAFDRVLAFDAIALHFVAAVLLISVVFETVLFMDVVLVVALLGFLGTLSLAAWLEGSLVE